MQTTVTLFNFPEINDQIKSRPKVWQQDFAKPSERLDFSDYQNEQREKLMKDLSQELGALEKRAGVFQESIRIAAKAKRR